MSNEDKETKIKDILKNQDLYKVYNVSDINHKPHPYCITEKHITGKYMCLTEDNIIQLEKEGSAHCGMFTNGNVEWKNSRTSKFNIPCNLSYEEHTSDNVCLLQLLRNGTSDEANVILKDLVDKVGESFVDGFVFVDTDEQYRIS